MRSTSSSLTDSRRALAAGVPSDEASISLSISASSGRSLMDFPSIQAMVCDNPAARPVRVEHRLWRWAARAIAAAGVVVDQVVVRVDVHGLRQSLASVFVERANGVDFVGLIKQSSSYHSGLMGRHCDVNDEFPGPVKSRVAAEVNHCVSCSDPI